MKPFVLLLSLFVGIASCSSDDEPATQPLTVEYNETLYLGSFYNEGSTDLPEVTWGGDSGTFSIDNKEDYISIDEETGVISWDKMLPVGLHVIEVEAANSTQEIEIVIEIENQLEGTFQGGFSTAPSEVTGNKIFATLEADGNFKLSSVLSEDTTAEGTWWLEEGYLMITYTTIESKETRSILATLNQAEDEASFTGEWIIGEFPEEGDIEDLIQGQVSFTLLIKK